MRKKVFNLFAILVIGGLGGVLADQFFLPYLSTVPLFSKIKFVRQSGNGTTIINPTEKIVITENTAIEDAVSKVGPCLVIVQALQGEKIISQGSGFVIASDGLIITAADNISTKADRYLIFRNSHSLVAEVVKKDAGSNLALLKIGESNLPVVSFVDFEDLRLGQRIILIGAELTEEGLNRFVNLGIIRSIYAKILKINLTEQNSSANGGPLVNIKGEVIGLNLVDQKGLIETIPSSQIKLFAGF
ncbi:MAG: serine protease [Candidatus Portnoybacteria bacterium]|nr:serine protease [Candidatus Portnoybacteria bacterium]